MARDSRDIATKDGAAQSAPAPVASPIDKALAGNRIADHHRDQLLALVRALARDAARADHAAEGDNL